MDEQPKKTSKINGEVRISLKTLITCGCLLVAVTVYIVAGLTSLGGRIDALEKRMDRFEENQGKMLDYWGMRPAKK